MTVHTPGIVSASALLARGEPGWLRRWRDFAGGLTVAMLPDPVLAQTKLILLDSIGAVACGMQETEMRRLVDRLARLEGEPADGHVAIGSGRRLTPLAAAFVNGTAGTMLELDEGHRFARGHPGMHVIPAALVAAVRNRRSGADLLVAITLGYEIGARLGAASRLRVAMHPHGTWGTVGAGLAAALLGGAKPAQLAETINVVASLSVSASLNTMLEGGTVRNTYAGFSNRQGLMAWELVAAGFVGEFDGVRSVYDGIVGEGFDPSVMTDRLGERWEVTRNYFKRHAACRHTHGALDAMCEILRQAGGRLDPAAISAISVDSYSWAAQLDASRPRNMLAAKFSLPYALAACVVHGGAPVPAFREPSLSDPGVLALAQRVSVNEDVAMTARLPAERPSRVRVRLVDGRVLDAQVAIAKGDAEDPYTPADVREKFHDLVDPVWGADHARAVRAAVEDLDSAADTAALLTLLARCPI